MRACYTDGGDSIGVYGVISPAGPRPQFQVCVLGLVASARWVVTSWRWDRAGSVCTDACPGHWNLSTIVNLQSSGWFAGTRTDVHVMNWFMRLPRFGGKCSAVGETEKASIRVGRGDREMFAGQMVE